MDHHKTFVCAFAVLFSVGFAQPTDQPGPQLYNGSPVYSSEASKYRYMGSIGDSSGYILCGAFIINPSWYLTAAHCVTSLSTKSGTDGITMRVGPYNARANLVISHVIIHPQYNQTSGANDIALAKVSPDIEFSNKVGSIPIIEETPSVGTSAVVSGYGAAFPAGDSGLYLHYSQVAVADKKVCPGLLEGQLCVTPSVLCEGDGGDPLVKDGNLIGIGVSDSHCGKTTYDVYVDVVRYKDWIAENCSAENFLSPLALLSTLVAILKIRC